MHIKNEMKSALQNPLKDTFLSIWINITFFSFLMLTFKKIFIGV